MFRSENIFGHKVHRNFFVLAMMGSSVELKSVPFVEDCVSVEIRYGLIQLKWCKLVNNWFGVVTKTTSRSDVSSYSQLKHGIGNEPILISSDFVQITSLISLLNFQPEL